MTRHGDGIRRARARRPAPGNHEYHTPGAAAYLKYFGETVGSPGRLYYSFNLGAWHIIALDSQCKDAGGCQKGSPEEVWLRNDLERNTANCILAFWHAPLFSSGGEHGNAPQMKPFWDDLYVAGADVVLNGHDHDYERFAPQNPDGIADPERGIREFVVGTGGKSKRGFRSPSATSEVRDSSTFGVLQMTLRAHDYEWKFIPVAGSQFSDSGSGNCHKQHPAFSSQPPQLDNPVPSEIPNAKREGFLSSSGIMRMSYLLVALDDGLDIPN
jgi:hypothetical protein